MMTTAHNIRSNIRSDQQGASILIALLFFLVCAMVGGVVLTAATVTTGQLVELEKSQQAYYSTTSAAELFRDAIVGGTCQVGSGGEAWTCTLPGENSTGTGSLSSWLAAAVQEAADATADDAVGTADAQGFVDKLENITVSLSDGDAAGVLDVTATMGMYADCSLRLTFQPKDYSAEIGRYQVICEIPAALLHQEDLSVIERVTWERALISKPTLEVPEEGTSL